MKTACVEREHLGGICLNWGCIPTKALLRSAEVGHLLQHADAYGFSASNVTFDLKKVVDRSRKVANQLSGGVKHLLKKNKVEVFDGHGRLNGAGKLKVEKDGKPVADLTAKNIILATGARARALPGLEPDGKLVWTYKEAMVPPTMPKSLLVVGSGAIGIEFASFYRTLGAEVTVVEVLDRVLPVEDAEISAFARKAFEKQGMKILTSATVKALKKGADNVTATIEAGGKSQDITVDRVILAIGIVGNVENLGLEGTKVKVEKTHVVVDGYGATGEPGVYAIGDLAGPPWLAHKASHEGVICVEKIAGVKGVHPLAVRQHPGLHLLHAPGGERRPDRAGGQGQRLRGESGQIPLHRQWQGDRAGRAGGPGQDRVRRQDRRIARGTYDRRGGDGADPGLYHRQDHGDDRGRADAHHLPASDPVGDDARSGAGGLRPRDPYVDAAW